MPITRGSNLNDAPVEIRAPCFRYLVGETLEEARRRSWDPLKFFQLLAGCKEKTKEDCFDAIIDELSTMPGAGGCEHIMGTLKTGTLI